MFVDFYYICINGVRFVDFYRSKTIFCQLIKPILSISIMYLLLSIKFGIKYFLSISYTYLFFVVM